MVVGKQETMAAEALEKSALESKDKDQLMAIAEALGVKTTARASKATLVEKILEKTGANDAPAPKARAPKAEKASAESGDDRSANDKPKNDKPQAD